MGRASCGDRTSFTPKLHSLTEARPRESQDGSGATGATGATGPTGSGSAGLIATASSVATAQPIATNTVITPDITYTAGAGENLIVTGVYRLTNSSGAAIEIQIEVNVTGQSPQVISGLVPASDNLMMPYAYRYSGLSGAITVHVFCAAASGTGVSIGAGTGSSTIIQRTSV